MTAALTPELQLLQATAEDYEGVVAISDGLYVGVDYLQYTYHAWLKDPQRKMFVAKSEGKVVAFGSFLLVDDGETAVLQAIHVAPWMRHSGVARIIHKFTLDNLRSDFPNVTRIHLTTMENPPANMMISHRIIHCKAVVSVFLSAKELEEAFRILESRIPIACKESLPPVFLDYSEVHSLFSRSLKEEDLVPERFLIQSWLPITTCSKIVNVWNL
uniref:N-acetyltransferase domain-containing protein n=1 Tax=Leptobrachium leishanense TaxID=445787 RepID=A0A8C5QWF6_9ANUR